ncbi:hypothetical protein BKM16_00775 [Pseudomonas amygdali pv. morsprunorum]|nr:hypothetical protein BKM22_00775 [Pseudomonas amygdali pv. morsprunorum]POD48937.1 hypothetical protein BKM16_00775 [Pseudomonas amygdali pv. morsprunorum]POD54232.1 hypothetical protein BKM02_00780 [Pseudomonas amygdali pv. morsprunorum]
MVLRKYSEHCQSRNRNILIIRAVIRTQEQLRLYSVARCTGLKSNNDSAVTKNLNRIFLLMLNLNVSAKQPKGVKTRKRRERT